MVPGKHEVLITSLRVLSTTSREPVLPLQMRKQVTLHPPRATQLTSGDTETGNLSIENGLILTFSGFYEMTEPNAGYSSSCASGQLS
jgi:hypothetical protein